MTPPPHTPPPTRAWPLWRIALTALTLIALTLSASLAWHSLTAAPLPGCTAGQACDQILSTRWSTVARILPVSGLAAGAYLAMLLASLFLGPNTPPPDRRLAWSALLILSTAAAAAALWFIALQHFVIHAFCPWCMATHLTALLLFPLTLWQSLQARDVDRPLLPRRLTTCLPLLGLALAAILATLQLTLTPAPLYSTGQSQTATTPDPHTLPLAGSPDAPYLVTLFFDYSCPHCQRLHNMLDDVLAAYHGKLAFALCPAPLNSHCNPYVAQDSPPFKDSCELTKIALAVWLAKPDTLPAFNHWMFAAEPNAPWRPRTPQAATAQAITLVGQSNFTAATQNPALDRLLRTSLTLYSQSLQEGNAVPKLVYQNRWVIPQPTTPTDLLTLLHQTLNLPPPTTP